MACPLLEKLAPETRNLIYEYVLTFNTPLKHARKMQPFIEKLYQSSDSETDTESSAGSSHMEDTLQSVGTALLSTCRLIFKEAVVIFYENNTIYLDADHCEVARIFSPQATDLSLATKVMMKITEWDDNTKSLSTWKNGIGFAIGGIPCVFSKLHSAEIYIYTDNSKSPVKMLFGLAAQFQRLADVVFEGVGSFTARIVSQPRIVLRMQCKAMVERWVKEEREFSWSSVFDTPVSFIYTYSQDGHVNRDAVASFNLMRRSYLPDGYPEVAEDSFEFWTIVDDAFQESQLLIQHIPNFRRVFGYVTNRMAQQAGTSTSQPNNMSSERSSGNESGGEEDASKSIEEKPESELDSAVNDADDQAFQKKS